MKIRFGSTKFSDNTLDTAFFRAVATVGISPNCPMPVNSHEIFGGLTIVICRPPTIGSDSMRGRKMMKTSPSKFNFRMPMVAAGGTWMDIFALQSQRTPTQISTPGCPPSPAFELPNLSTDTGPSTGGLVPKENSWKQIPWRKCGTAALRFASTSSFMSCVTAALTNGHMTSTPKFSQATFSDRGFLKCCECSSRISVDFRSVTSGCTVSLTLDLSDFTVTPPIRTLGPTAACEPLQFPIAAPAKTAL
mmetsp:Transcript_113745/g.328455  ORF Transcript_113745/g.328455 Transcript_113745/m.328455 type:complete len:248 (+) Transcript_113745:1455-2198(+)